MAFLDHLTSLMGDKTDLSQFKIRSEIDQLPPDQKKLAFQLLQQFLQQQQGGGQGSQQPGQQLPQLQGPGGLPNA